MAKAAARTTQAIGKALILLASADIFSDLYTTPASNKSRTAPWSHLLTYLAWVYTFGDTDQGGGFMAKALSLKLDGPTYQEAEKIRKRLKLPRNTYIRKAVRSEERRVGKEC